MERGKKLATGQGKALPVVSDAEINGTVSDPLRQTREDQARELDEEYRRRVHRLVDASTIAMPDLSTDEGVAALKELTLRFGKPVRKRDLLEIATWHREATCQVFGRDKDGALLTDERRRQWKLEQQARNDSDEEVIDTETSQV